MAPGVAVPLRLLCTLRAGIPLVGVVTEPQVCVPLTQAVLVTAVTPAGSGLAMVTAKRVEAEPPAGTLATARVQAEPGEVPEHDHPAALAPAFQAVLAGTVSPRVTGPESWLPELLTTSR